MIVSKTEKKNDRTYYPTKYMLTRNACYKVLARSFNEDKFADYFSMKWQISEQYKKYSGDYDSLIERRRIEESNREVVKEKNCKIDELLSKVDDQSLKIDHQSSNIEQLLAANARLEARADELIVYGKNTSDKLDKVTERLDDLFELMVGFAKMMVPMWIGSEVFRTQLNNFLEDKTSAYALKHLKVMFIVAFEQPLETEEVRTSLGDNEISVCTELTVYFCCTNFANVGNRIRELHKRHGRTMYMMKPQAVCMISTEINSERIKLERMSIFPEDVSYAYATKQKAFVIGTTSGKQENVTAMYDKIVENARRCQFQGYQMRRNAYIDSEDHKLSEKILSRIISSDSRFYDSVRPICQEYIDCYIGDVLDKDGKLSEYKYKTASLKTITRVETGERLTDSMYALTKLERLIVEDGSHEVERMVADGIITKKDIKALKQVAKAENVDTSEFDDKMPDSSDDEECKTDTE